ncbi:Lrp/AsnC family transcriptional regulator [Candidatus Woesearchaeota archaeon]|nr:Lrp/AsnC family transcriptional regulator [Candidatus Woesearchaeota archaeon]
MVSDKELLILSRLRKNAREKLSSMSRKTQIPVSTIFEKIKEQEGNVIRKHTCLLDFSALGFHVRVHILIKVKFEDRDAAGDFFNKCFQINSVLRINNGYDYMLEGIFRDILELEDFCEKIEKRFLVEKKDVYYITKEIKREDFLADSNKAELLSSSPYNRTSHK